MKRCLLWLLMLTAGCASDLPRWQSDAFDYLYFYQTNTLTGDKNTAAMNFRKALNSVNSSGKIEALNHVILYKCAIDQAAFLACPEIGALHHEYLTEPQYHYKQFLDARTEGINIGLLPEHYRDFYRALHEGEDLTPSLQDIEPPLARLIAASIALKHYPNDFEILSIADRTASGQGWRVPLRYILGQLKKYYRQSGDTQAVKKMDMRLDMLDAQR
ncbi:MAG: hypothetical protein Q7U57_10295 [Methylovulum sp.]|nr:hypothetical protein [Methylovulum sp.]